MAPLVLLVVLMAATAGILPRAVAMATDARKNSKLSDSTWLRHLAHRMHRPRHLKHPCTRKSAGLDLASLRNFSSDLIASGPVVFFTLALIQCL